MAQVKMMALAIGTVVVLFVAMAAGMAPNGSTGQAAESESDYSPDLDDSTMSRGEQE